MHSGEIMALLCSMRPIMSLLVDEFLTLPYSLEIESRLLKINQCAKWVIAEIFKHFTRQAIVIRMLLHQVCSREGKKITEDSEDS
jgi:hypothetical protein